MSRFLSSHILFDFRNASTSVSASRVKRTRERTQTSNTITQFQPLQIHPIQECNASDILIDYRPLSIARLGLFGPAAAVRGSNYHSGEDNAHHKAGLVEVVGIVVENIVFDLNVVYKGKPLANNLWDLRTWLMLSTKTVLLRLTTATSSTSSLNRPTHSVLSREARERQNRQVMQSRSYNPINSTESSMPCF